MRFIRIFVVHISTQCLFYIYSKDIFYKNEAGILDWFSKMFRINRYLQLQNLKKSHVFQSIILEILTFILYLKLFEIFFCSDHYVKFSVIHISFTVMTVGKKSLSRNLVF